MKFISIRDLGNQLGAIKRAATKEPVTLTSNGKPFALFVGLHDHEDPAELERLIRQARAQLAVSRIRSGARKNGTDALSMDDIDAEIQAALSERRR